MRSDNTISRYHDIVLSRDYHTAVAKPAILLDDYPPSGRKSLLQDRYIHIKIVVVVVCDEYVGSK